MKDVPMYAYIAKRAHFKRAHSTNQTGLQGKQQGTLLFSNASMENKV
jgi:hypothetical protein